MAKAIALAVGFMFMKNLGTQIILILVVAFILGGIINSYRDAHGLEATATIITIWWALCILYFNTINGEKRRSKDIKVNIMSRETFDKILMEEGVSEVNIRNEIWGTRPSGNLGEPELRKLAQKFLMDLKK